jgi:dTDP-4-dehydrorhamnose reductase
MKKRVLVTGASGFLGWNLCRLWKGRFSLLGCYHTHKIVFPGVETVQIDLTAVKRVEEVFDTFRPHIVVHTAALSHPNYCEEHADESYKVNVQASETIAELSQKYGAKLVYTSSDMVFDGKHPPYRENSPINPVNRYGEHKALAETRIRQHNVKAAVCRLTPMYGRPGPYGGGFLHEILSRLKSGREVFLFTDEFRTPLNVEDAAAGLICAAGAEQPVLHLAGDERVSRYEWGCMIACICGFNKRLLKPLRQDQRQQRASRPPDLSLNNSLAKSMGFRVRNMHEILKAYK